MEEEKIETAQGKMECILCNLITESVKELGLVRYCKNSWKLDISCPIGYLALDLFMNFDTGELQINYEYLTLGNRIKMKDCIKFGYNENFIPKIKEIISIFNNEEFKSSVQKISNIIYKG